MPSVTTLYTITMVVLTLTVKVRELRGDDPRLAEELKCLNASPKDRCNLHVSFAAPLQTLGCNVLVAEDDGASLKEAPAIKAPNLSGPLSQGVLVMFDPDAPISNQAEDGFLHWLALVSVDDNGNVHITRTIQAYYAPSPPRGKGPHRYQLFLFNLASGNHINGGNGKKFQLCRFMQDNSLGQPLGVFQFRYERT